VLFARALERRSHENAALLVKLATVLGAPDSGTTALLEATRIRLVLADAKGAREALALVEKKEPGPISRRLALGLGALLGKDRARAGAYFGREGLSPEDGARAEKALLAFVLERPMDAANDLPSLLGKETSPRAHLDLAASLCANDAPGALAQLVRAGTERASGDALAVLDAVGLSIGQGQKDVQDALAAKGLSPEEARVGTALVRAEKSLKPPWNEPTFPELERTWKAGELDPLLVSSAHDLAPLRPDVRFEKLIRALER
jgi:hypothetical protein